MTTYTWIGASGDWDAASNWGPTGVPTDLDTVTISTPGITVTVNTGDNASALSLLTIGSQFDIGGGNLFTVQNANFGGSYTQSAGTYTLSGNGATFNGYVNFTGGKIDALTGKLLLVDGGTLAGTLAGAGTLEISGVNGAQVNITKGFNCQLNTIQVDNGGKLAIFTGVALAHNLTVNNGVLDMFGNTLALNATAVLSGFIGNGTINVNNTLTLGTAAYNATLDNGLLVNDLKSIIQSNTIALGVTDSGAKISVSKAGLYAINGNWGITDASGVGSITNAGVFAKTGGGKASQIDTSVTSTGTLQANIGELRLNGLVNSIAGVVSGLGTLGIEGGQTTLSNVLTLSVACVHQEGGVLVLNGPHSYAGAWDLSGGVLNLNSRTAALTLSGRSDFDGGRITSFGGTLNLSGQSEMNGVVIGGPTVVNVTGTVNETGGIYFGNSSNSRVNIAAGATWLNETDSNISGIYGNFVNSGWFDDPNGSGDALIQTNFSNEASGTITSNSTLTLAGGNDLAGTLAGTGLIDLGGSSASSLLEAGLVINVAELDVSSGVNLAGNQSDAHAFSEFSSALLNLGGSTFALSGPASLEFSALTGGGILSTAGQTTIAGYTIEGGAELLVAGHADQTSNLTITGASGDGTLGIQAGAVYTVEDDLNNSIVSGTVSLAGTLIENGIGNPLLASDILLAASGDIVVNSEAVFLQDGGSLQGTISGPGRTELQIGTFTLGSGLSVLSSGLDFGNNVNVDLTANQQFAGDFTGEGTLALGANTLTLSGPNSLGQPGLLTVSGTGSLVAGGATAIGAVNVVGNATLDITGQAQQSSAIAVGDPAGGASTATFLVAHGATDTLLTQSGFSGDGTLTVAGSLLANGNQAVRISTGIVDTGTIAANLGTLQIGGTVAATSSGSFSIGAGATLEFLNTSAVGTATGVNFTGAGILRIDELQGFNATIENFASKDAIQLVNLNPTSLSGSYGSSHSQIIVTDGQNDIALNFSTAQTLSSLSFGAGAGGIATLTHT